MILHDEFEYTTQNGKIYFVELKVDSYREDGQSFTNFLAINIYDELNNLVDETNEDYNEVFDAVNERDYECPENYEDSIW